MPQTLNADYKVIVLSGNAFLWLGLKTFISQSVDPCPEIFWINDVSPEGILPLRQLMLNIRVKKGGWYSPMRPASTILKSFWG